MAARKRPTADIAAAARDRFGFQTLRPGQKEAIEALLDGRDALVVQPTGAGKSAIYQIAGLFITGSTVIVSPLIALQKDQVDSLADHDAAPAALVNSTRRTSETRETLRDIEAGEVEYIFLAPEQLRKRETLEKLKAARISLFAVDEAHCISEWGHDFRPDYLNLGSTIETLDHPVVLAMTATASPEVRAEIVQRLGMRNPKVLVNGFNRPNISLRVDSFSTEKDKREALVHRVKWADKPGIVYVATRKNAEEIMRALDEEGVHALFYHGGLKAKERDEIQERFMSGGAEVIVATNAFGMGVDKADIRFVYHFDVAASLDSYYQEIGRAGRDGENAEAVLFYRAENIGSQKFRTGEGAIDPEKIEEVANILTNEGGPLDPKEISEQTDLSERKVAGMLHRLEDVEAVEKLPSGEVQLVENVDVREAALAAAEEQERHKEQRRQKLEQMRQYAETGSCRREFLLRYFGDDFAGPCNNCDNCQADQSAGTRREVA